MRGSPYVNRGIRWDNKSKSYVPGPTIIVGERIPGPCETDYNDKFSLTPDEARYVATELWKLAEEIDGKQDKESKLKLVKEVINDIVAEAKAEADL